MNKNEYIVVLYRNNILVLVLNRFTNQLDAKKYMERFNRNNNDPQYLATIYNYQENN